MVKKVYSLAYRHWLWNDFYQCHDKVIEVKGWRTARIESKSGERVLASLCFKIFGFSFN